MSGMDNLRTLRKQRRLTQAQLAEKVGIDQGYLSKLENGDGNVTLDKIKLIAEALNVHPSELFGLPALQSRALLALNDLDPAKREAAILVLEAMAQK